MAISAIRSNNYLKMTFGMVARPARATAAPAAGLRRAAVASALRSSARATPAPLTPAATAAPVGRRGVHSAASARNWFAVVQDGPQDARMPTTNSFSAHAAKADNWHAAAQSFVGSPDAVRRVNMNTTADNWYRAAQEATRGAAPVSFDRDAWNWWRAAGRA